MKSILWEKMNASHFLNEKEKISPVTLIFKIINNSDTKKCIGKPGKRKNLKAGQMEEFGLLLPISFEQEKCWGTT